MDTISIKNLGVIDTANINLGDFTLFVGEQATGKSTVLQLIKLLVDMELVAGNLLRSNYVWKNSKHFLELFFGEGGSDIFKENTEVIWQGKNYSTIDNFPPKLKDDSDIKYPAKVFYVPAQRVLAMQQGWPRSFESFDVSEPYILKGFSENTRLRLEELMQFIDTYYINVSNLSELIDKSIFHGAKIKSDSSLGRKRLIFEIEDNTIPYNSWSTGQREFMPLLVSVLSLLNPINRWDKIKWVIIEEPEMGLHPQAIQALMVVFMELMSRGYKLIISTHSPVFLELLWAVNYIKKYNGTAEDLADLLSTGKEEYFINLFDSIIKQDKQFGTYYFERQSNGKIKVKDISSLYANSEDDAIANWGGLTSFATKAGEIVSKLVP